MPTIHKMPFPSKRRALELGASHLEQELHKMRTAIRLEEEQVYNASRTEEGALPVRPLSTSHEADMMKAVEWAWSAATLRALAERED